MNPDHMDDKIVSEQIALRTAQDIARQIADEQDPDYSPWGGKFSDKPLDKQVFAVEKAGNC